MDEYERKFAEMQKYIPFLEAMIERLKKVKDQSRASQLQKMQSLHGILTDSKRKLKLETLQRCEDVLQKLHSKVEKGNSTGSKLQNNKNSENTRPDITGHLEPKIECTTDEENSKDTEMKHKLKFVKKTENDETPASPSPPASPDQISESKTIKPIIIPTERSDGFTGTVADDRPASPDACEMIVSSVRTPIIIPTERETPNPLRKVDPDPVNQKVPAWAYPEPMTNRVAQGTNLWQSDSSSRSTDGRNRLIRHIPTVPAPSKGSGCVLRKPVLVLDKKLPYTDTESPTTKLDPLNVSESSLRSPDRDGHISRNIKNSPKSKELPPLPKLSTTSLLTLPPPVLTMPPLTSEDIAELLQEEGDSKNDKRSQDSNKEDTSKKVTSDGAADVIQKSDKRSDGKTTSSVSNTTKKDERSSKTIVFTPMDVDRDCERRWEEIDKPIIRMQSHQTSRKNNTNPSGTSLKHTDSRGSTSSSSVSVERPTDPRNRPPSPNKDREQSTEVRYADNYEKHPRHSRDNTKHNSQSDLSTTNSAFSRNSESDSKINSEERSSALYQRRSHSGNGPAYQELDPRREKGVEFYKNIVQREREEKQRERDREMQREREREMQRERDRELQREREIEREMLHGINRGINHHSPGRGGEPCTQPQWNQNMNYPPGPQGPNMYPQQQRPDRWMHPGSNNMPMEPHMMPPQYQGPPNSCGRPMLSPQDISMGPCMDRNMGPCMDMNMGPRIDSGCMDMNMGPRLDSGCMDMNMGQRMDTGFRDDMQNQNMGPQQHPPGMTGMMQPQGYPMGPQYHQFPQENRSNVQQFDRPPDFPHSRQSWDQSGNRPIDNVQYPRPQGPAGPHPVQWNRPNRGSGVVGGGPQPVPPPLITPPLPPLSVSPVAANRNFNDRSRGPDSSRNVSYNRDPREHRDSRDPRMRAEGSTNPQNLNTSTTVPPPITRREHSRFSKETPQPSPLSSKPKETLPPNDRNQRRRPNDPKEINKPNTAKDKDLEKEKARKRDEEKRRDSKYEKKREKESETKSVNDKLSKDVMQSPLESLYGVIDTTAKTGKGYGFQKFKIPKLKRPEPAPLPPKVVEDTVEMNWTTNDDITESTIVGERDSEITEIARPSTGKETEDKKSEVTSTTGDSSEDPQSIDDSDCNATKEISAQSAERTSIANKLSDSEQIVGTSTKVSEDINPTVKESEAPKLKEEVTQELIQALIRKSLESGEVKELFENKLRQKFGEAFQGKKFQKILNIIDSESESSSDKEKLIENRKVGVKKKRRVIVSDSSDEECLAKRLGKINTVENDKTQVTEPRIEETSNEKENAAKSRTKKNSAGSLEEETPAKTTNESLDSGAGDKQETNDNKEKPFRRKRRGKKDKPALQTQEKPANDAETGIEKDQNTEEKSQVPAKNPPIKPKPKRRNSLEMLQEDIREMFISEGVITATGHRMCRLIKEAQENVTTPAENPSKKGSTGSLDRHGSKNESDFEEEVQRPQSVNSRGQRGRSKGRRRTRVRVKSRKTITDIISSDSETEDSVRTEISLQNERNEIEKNPDESSKANSSDNPKTGKDDAESSHFLRRSERVGLRDSIKELRGNDKSELGKSESSKTMFDSSSDESFGIDVSELTAAVDISLHPEPRGRITSSPVARASSKAKSTVSRKQRASKAKQSTGKIEKNENNASGDEVESIASDLSRASSLTRGKKANCSNVKQDTNEELMSDLLIGLVNSKPSDNKSMNDDAETEIDSALPSGLKNTGRKKKKKKASWAMGIVKRKKKKMQSPIPTASAEMESTVINRAEIQSSFDETETDRSSMNFETKEENLSDASGSKCANDSNEKITNEQIIIGKTEPCSPQKNVSSVNISDMEIDIENENKKPLDELLMDDKINDKDDSEKKDESDNLDIEKLLSYIWLPKKDRFNCLYCQWSGKNIVHHYTLNHGEKEMMISRLSVEDSEVAIKEARTGDYEKRIPKTVTKDIRKFQCRFCAFKTVGSPTMAIEAFYEHCTTHTGEYRFRCRGCTYQTVARSSMRTHCSRRRNNPCRSSYVNTHMAIQEDPIPDDDFLYGYLCTKCNFVQLKESNVIKHMKLRHEDSSNSDILKIDMSSYVDDDLYNTIETVDTKTELKEENELLVETQVDLPETPEFGNPKTSIGSVAGRIADDTDSIDIVDEALNDPFKKEEDTSSAAKSASEAETLAGTQEITAGNLNAFVCPPELENKEDEIQLERQKKMEEIVKNIGLSNNLSEKRDLSIIDKLKDKMTENLSENIEDGESEEADTPDQCEKVSSDETSSSNLPILLPESVTSLAEGDNFAEQIQDPLADPIKTEPEETLDENSPISKDEVETSTEDKSEKKIKDPLTNLDEAHKGGSSDEDESDNETVTEQPPSYESDTSTEQSDAEVSTDVNSLLEETFNINTTANAPMMTTIQRLAAKLQGEKPFASSSGKTITEKSDDTEQQQTSDRIIPKKPNAIPISSLQKFLGRRNAMLQEVAKEVGVVVKEKDSSAIVSSITTSSTEPSSPPKSPAKSPPKSPAPPSSPPKKFIRLRRLSGDKLSVPSPVDAPAEITPLQASRASSLDGSTSDTNAEVLQTDTEEECSFLRIENVVSLAPGLEHNPTELTMDDIRMSMASTSIKSPGSVSLLKKGNPNIIKRSSPGTPVMNVAGSNLPIRPAAMMPVSNLSLRTVPTTNIPIRPAPTPIINLPIRPSPTLPSTSLAIKPAPTSPITNIASRSSIAAGLPVSGIPVPPAVKHNFKIVKVVRGLTLMKQKDSTHRIFGNKLKTPEAFSNMLQPVKLRHFYKCMSRFCSYTTDCQQSFGLHYRHHKENVDRSKGVMTTHDFQRCPYCSETLTTWNAMSEHLKDKHIYCQYQCNYCFYRALAQSYVELHQMTVHQGAQTSVLLGQRESPPIEVIDRREFVIPFVCHHECGKSFYVPGAFLAHLRAKHGNSLSIFKCHLCPAPSFKAEQLVAHYKLHGIYKYQCLYCLFGSEECADVHAHLSASHYNRPPHILERTLQPRPVRDKDVIQQLMVLNVDESYKCSEITLVPGQDSSDIPTTKHWLQVDRNTTNDGSATIGDMPLNIANVGMNRFFSHDKADANEPAATTSTPTSPVGNNQTPVITKIRKISPNKSSENILIVDDNGAIRKISKRKSIISEATTSETKNINQSDSPKSTVGKTIPHSSSTNAIQCNEEFVNFNILDNPDFLKVVDSENGVKTAVEPIELKDDDSDIEILEDIAVSPKTPTPSIKTDTSPAQPVNEGIVIKKQEPADSPEKATDDPSINCSSNENTSEANVGTNSTPVDVGEAFERPLTLNDIKNTGFTGSQLYRCGYDGCEYGADTTAQLRLHIKECFYASDTKNLNCVHCNKRFVKIGFLVEHFKLHGLKRFGCSMCPGRWPMPYQAMSHMKSKHKQTYTKLIPADPKNPSADGLFIVEPIPTNGTSRSKKRGRVKSLEKEADKSGDNERSIFGPSDIEALPRQAIYQREVQCAVCPYTNKVRTNIIRHLQLHAKDETVPESGPVNPVPCLDKKERMFDKMVNLASSSHQNGRMGGKVVKEPAIDSNAEFLPKFVPEHKRYVCGVTECNYLTCDESMLRYHLKALHPDETYFRCPHCPAPAPGHETQNVAIEKMAVHLKMHDSRLYKCSHCNNHHYHRHVVERHLSDKHPDVNPYVKVIREPESTESVQQPSAQEEGDENNADTEGNHWKCNLCEWKCIYKTEMVTHAATSHEEKGQFKCNTCSYKTNNKISFDQHVNAKHPYDLNADCTLTYQKIKGIGLRKPATDASETGALDEPFDTTPLWRRDMPRVRHIRGILFEEEKPEGKSNKRKSDTDISTKPAKSRPGKTTVSDVSNLGKDSGSLWNETFAAESSLSDPTLDIAESFREAEAGSSTFAAVDMAKLTRKFGPLGSPIAVFYRCTICQTFKTKYKHDMRDHLYRDLKYWRYRCTLCGYTGVNKTASLKHFERSHEPRRPTEKEQTTLPVDHELETWVQALLKSQTNQMRSFATTANGKSLQDVKQRKPNSTNVRRSSTETSGKANLNVTQSPVKDPGTKTKTVDLIKTINEMQKKTVLQDAEHFETDDVLVEDDEEDSRDFDALVIDSKEDRFEAEEMTDDTTSTNETRGPAKISLSCKHCDFKTLTVRGFKLHVELRHLRRNTFLCLYCDTSLNSEAHMTRHLRVAHPDLPATVVRNPVTNPPELTPDFWEKEYQLVSRDKPRKRKRKEDMAIDPFEKKPAVSHVCNKCGYHAMNYFGLSVHMRRHISTKDFKCAYCTYAASTKSDLWIHSEANHSTIDWKVGNGDVGLAGKSEMNSKIKTLNKDRIAESYYDYEDGTIAGTSGSLIVSKADMMYSCFYCNSGNTTLEGVEEHWKMVHKSTTKTSNDGTTQRTGLPFRYKEIPSNPSKNCLRCGYCPKRGTAAQIRLHSRKKHASKPVKFVEVPLHPLGWICQWCKEVCDTEAKKKVHHNLFHSHLTPSFKRQEPSTSNDGVGHECPECPFKSTSRIAMEKHLEKHVDSVICKRCDKTFRDVSIGILHNTQAHPGEVSKIEGFKTNVEKMMARVKWKNDGNQDKNTFETVGRSALEKNWKHCGVARKSTTKSLIPVQPVPTDIKSVARKSTNPLPRYPPGIRFSTSEDGDTKIDERKERNISYYGKPITPVNLTNINTYITLSGGRRMKLTCSALAQLIDIEPYIVIDDFRNDAKKFQIHNNKS